MADVKPIETSSTATESRVYAVKAVYNFEPGSYCAPTDGVVAVVPDRAEADKIAHLLCPAGDYYLSSGQFGRPYAEVREITQEQAARYRCHYADCRDWVLTGDETDAVENHAYWCDDKTTAWCGNGS